jgi:hypothetical protein
VHHHPQRVLLVQHTPDEIGADRVGAVWSGSSAQAKELASLPMIRVAPLRTDTVPNTVNLDVPLPVRSLSAKAATRAEPGVIVSPRAPPPIRRSRCRPLRCARPTGSCRPGRRGTPPSPRTAGGYPPRPRPGFSTRVATKVVSTSPLAHGDRVATSAVTGSGSTVSRALRTTDQGSVSHLIGPAPLAVPPPPQRARLVITRTPPRNTTFI